MMMKVELCLVDDKYIEKSVELCLVDDKNIENSVSNCLFLFVVCY